LALAHPWRHMAGLVLTLIGVWFCWRRDARLAAVGQLSLGLACVDVWGPVVQAAIEEVLLPLETSLAFLILSRLGDFALIGNAISGSAGHTIVVEASCSAFLNIVATILLWLSFLKIHRQAAGRRQWIVLLLGVAWVVLVNTLRLDLCAWSSASYAFWHEGEGVAILEWSLLGGLLALFYFFAKDGERQLP
jgi:exosortase/archaeosortase family protein